MFIFVPVFRKLKKPYNLGMETPIQLPGNSVKLVNALKRAQYKTNL